MVLYEYDNVLQCKYCRFYMTCAMTEGPTGYCENWEDRLGD